MAKTNKKKGKNSKEGKPEKGGGSFNQTQSALRRYFPKKKDKKNKKCSQGLLSELEKSALQLKKGALGKRCQPASSSPVVKGPKKEKGEEELKRDLEKLRKQQKGLESQFSKLESRKNKEVKSVQKQINQLRQKIPSVKSPKQEIKIVQNKIKQSKKEVPQITQRPNEEIKNVQNQTNQSEKKLPQIMNLVDLAKDNRISKKQRRKDGLEDIELQFDDDGFCIIYTHGHYNNESGQAGIGILFGRNSKLNVAEPFQGLRFPYARRIGIQAATVALNIAKLADIRRVQIYLASEYVLSTVKKSMNCWEDINWELSHNFSVKDELELLRDAQKDMIVKWTSIKKSDAKNQAVRLAIRGAKKHVVSSL